MRRGAERGVPGVVDELHDLVPCEHQLADEVHQLIEQRDVDTNRAVGGGSVLLASRLLLVEGSGNVLLRGLALTHHDLADQATVTEFLLGGCNLDVVVSGGAVGDEKTTQSGGVELGSRSIGGCVLVVRIGCIADRTSGLGVGVGVGVGVGNRYLGQCVQTSDQLGVVLRFVGTRFFDRCQAGAKASIVASSARR
ncbi:MAG: hypothetical protein R2710_02810 [Acidimicrobiales bacterium]